MQEVSRTTGNKDKSRFSGRGLGTPLHCDLVNADVVN